MTFAPPTVSRVATRRIGIVNAVLWIVGSIVLTIVGATAAYSFVVQPYTPDDGNYFADYPWEDDEPLVATQAGEVWSADASGVIRIPAAEFAEPLQATVADLEIIVFRTNPSLGITPTDEYFTPELVGFLDPDQPHLIVPDGEDLELWVQAGEPWEMRLSPVSTTPMGDEGASGTGSVFLVYTGDAVSARFIHSGNGIFFVSVYTAFTDEQPIIDNGEVNERISWDPDTSVVFEIESEGGGWVVDIDQLASSTQQPTRHRRRPHDDVRRNARAGVQGPAPVALRGDE